MNGWVPFGRSVLVPVTMKLLGDWNWYLPDFLGWLPRLDIEGHAPILAPAIEFAGAD